MNLRSYAAIFCLSIVFSNLCRGNEELFNEQQIKAIKTAELFDYMVEILSGDVGGVQRVVFLLGECHIKDEYSEQAGRAILKLFPLRGLEGIYPNRKLTAYLITPAISLLTSLQQTLASEEKLSRGSSIHESFNNNNTERLIVVKPGSTAVADKVNIQIELGGNDLLLALAFNLYPAMLINAFFRYIPPLNSLTQENWVINLFSLYLFLQMFEQSLERKPEQTRPAFTLYSYWLIPYRNQLMVDNIIKSLKPRKFNKNMLVIVGQGHIAGMKKMLIEQYGFTRITQSVLEGVETDSALAAFKHLAKRCNSR